MRIRKFSSPLLLLSSFIHLVAIGICTIIISNSIIVYIDSDSCTTPIITSATTSITIIMNGNSRKVILQNHICLLCLLCLLLLLLLWC